MVRLTRMHSEFRHPGLSCLDYKTVDLDRVLTAFLARLHWDGYPSRLARHRDLGVEDFVDSLLEQEDARDGFQGFAAAPGITRRWVETHLVDMVNRGKPTQAVAGLRPLHGATYRYRNSKYSQPRGADEQLYEMLFAAPSRRGTAALRDLKEFFFSGLDAATGRADPSGPIDVETQALLHLCRSSKTPDDRPDTGRARQPHPAFCPSHSLTFADDVLRLMHHQGVMPRSVLVEHLKVLFAFHLALHHLRLVRVLPDMLAATRSTGGPPDDYRVGLLVDVTGQAGSGASLLAERSAAHWWRQIPAYVRAGYEVRKLDEFARHLVKLRKLSAPEGGIVPVAEAISLGRRRERAAERDAFFRQRLSHLVESIESDELPETVVQILDLGLAPGETYLEILCALRGDHHREFLTKCLDSLMLKNRPGALLAQPHARRRRFVLDSRLLEVLLQVALLAPDGDRFSTRPLRVDEFLEVLRTRYGLHVDQLPTAEGFGSPTIDDHAALRVNATAFVDRLREIGFYSDLSDAYLTQTIRPRYIVGETIR